MATKFVYTETEVKEIISKYAEGITLEVLAEEYVKSVASVRMKLVKLGLYKKAEKPTKITTDTGLVKTTFPTTKAAINAYFDNAMNLVGPSPM